MPPASVNRKTCLLCLDAFGSQEKLEGLGENLKVKQEDKGRGDFQELLQFCRRYLKLEGDTVSKVGEGEECQQLFCEGCDHEVKIVLEAWRQLERLKIVLLGRVGALREVIRKREKVEVAKRWKTRWITLCGQLGIEKEPGNCLEVKEFRRRLLEKCDLKAKRILPTITLERCAPITIRKSSRRKRAPSPINNYWESGEDAYDDDHFFEGPDSPELGEEVQEQSGVILLSPKKIKLERLPLEESEKLSPHQVELLLQMFLLYLLSLEHLDRLNLSQALMSLYTPAFIVVGRRSEGSHLVASRPTLQLFCHLITIFAIGHGIDLDHALTKFQPRDNPPRSQRLPSEIINRYKLQKTAKALPPVSSQKKQAKPTKRRKGKPGRPKGWKKSEPPSSKTESTEKKPKPRKPNSWKRPKLIDTDPNYNGSYGFRKRSAAQLQKMVENVKLPEQKPLSAKEQAMKLYQQKRNRKYYEQAGSTIESRLILFPHTLGFATYCPHCQGFYCAALKREDHLQKLHLSTPPPVLTCSVCNLTFNYYQILLQHLQMCHENQEEKPHYCYHCTETFATIQMRDLHKRDVHWILPLEFYCSVDKCPERFECVEDLHKHLTYHNSTPGEDKLEPQPVFSCNLCHWPFASEYQLQLHKFNHAVRTEGFLNCDMCPFKTRCAFKLSFHFNCEHGGANKLEVEECTHHNKCPVWSSSESYLEAHKQLVKVYSKKPPVGQKPGIRQAVRRCVYCSTFLDTEKETEVHELHCSEGPSQEVREKLGPNVLGCGKCSYSTKNRYRMRRHLNGHQQAMFPCPHCGKKFQRQDHTTLHIRRIHSKDGRHVCHLCGKIRASVAELKYHLTEHEMGHMCQECGKRFSRAWLLKVHMRSHTGERLQCPFCPSIYREAGQIRKHVEKEHKEEYLKEIVGRRRFKYKVVSRTEMEEQRQMEANNGGGEFNMGELKEDGEVEGNWMPF